MSEGRKELFFDGSEDEEGLRSRAFVVTGGDAPPSDEPPLDGLDYLRRVRWEAKNCADIVVVSSSSSSQPKKREREEEGRKEGGGGGGKGRRKRRRRGTLDYFQKGDEGVGGREVFPPGDGWKEHFIVTFGELREKLLRIEKTQNKEKLRKIGEKQWFEMAGTSEQDDNQHHNNHNNHNNNHNNSHNNNTKIPLKQLFVEPIGGHDPLLTEILSLDQVSLRDGLHVLVSHCYSPGGFSSLRRKWFFAILSLLESPVDADVSSDLRALVKFLFWLRNRVWEERGVGEGKEGEEEGGEREEIYAATGVLIVVAGGFFGQISDKEMIL